jgi:hypothetical protein
MNIKPQPFFQPDVDAESVDTYLVNLDTGDSTASDKDKYRHVINHGLGRVPDGCQIIMSDKECQVYVISANAQTITVRFSSDHASVKLKVWVEKKKQNTTLNINNQSDTYVDPHATYLPITAISGTSGKIAKFGAAGNTVIDGTNTDSDVADAVSKRHTQNTDSKLVASDGAPDAVTCDASGNVAMPQNLDVTGESKGGTGHFGDSSNYTNISSSGHQTMVGNARPWRDQLTDSLTIKVQGTGISTNASESTVEFATNADYNTDYLYCNIQLNHDKDLTASISPHIHFFQAENNIPNFLLEYRWQKNLRAKTTAWTKLKCNSLAVAYTSGTINNIAYSAAIAVPVGTALSDIVQFRIYRDTTNDSGEFTGADPYTAAVGITAFDVHFQINSLGSDDEYTK